MADKSVEDGFDPLRSCVYELDARGENLCGLPENHTVHHGGIAGSWPSQPEPHEFVRGDGIAPLVERLRDDTLIATQNLLDEAADRIEYLEVCVRQHHESEPHSHE